VTTLCRTLQPAGHVIIATFALDGPSKCSVRHDSVCERIIIMKTSLRLIGCALGFAALAVTGALAQSPESPAAISIQLVSTFDYPGTGNQTRPQKINTAGDIAGVFVDINGISYGFQRLANGHFGPPITDPNSPTPFTEGRGINDSGTVVGDYTDSAGAFEGFFLNHNTFTNYDPEPTFTIVLGVNNAGDFSGSVIPSSGIQSAFVSIGGVMTDFVVPRAAATLAYQINTTNTSCGYYIDTAGLTHGYYRNPDGTLHAGIDPAGSTGTIVFGNNDANFIVGRYSDAGGVTHGFLFIPPRRFVVYDFPGATFTSLNGINGSNQIVGRYTDPSTGIDHGILLQVVHSAAGVTLPLASPTAAPAAQALPQRPVYTVPAY
jgi:hypothetical protein